MFILIIVFIGLLDCIHKKQPNFMCCSCNCDYSFHSHSLSMKCIEADSQKKQDLHWAMSCFPLTLVASESAYLNRKRKLLKVTENWKMLGECKTTAFTQQDSSFTENYISKHIKKKKHVDVSRPSWLDVLRKLEFCQQHILICFKMSLCLFSQGLLSCLEFQLISLTLVWLI